MGMSAPTTTASAPNSSKPSDDVLNPQVKAVTLPIGPVRCRVRRAFRIAGNRKRERRAWSIIRLYPETATMSLDDRTADRQPDTHAVALGRVERIEQLVHALTLDADTGIPHRHAHMIPAF